MTAAFFPATSMPDRDWWAALWPAPGDTLAALGIAADTGAVVDLCCGGGLFTGALARLARRVIAIDLDPRMIGEARQAAAAPNIRFVVGDAEDIAALVRDPTDAVFFANTFHGVPDKARLAKGVAAVLKPRGRFVVVNWQRRPRAETIVLGRPRGPQTALRMAPEDVAAAIAGSGLALARVVELPPYHYGAVFVKAAAPV